MRWEIAMTPPDPMLTRSFQLSPTAAFATGMFRDRLLRLVATVAETAERSSYGVSDELGRRLPDRLSMALTYLEPPLKAAFDWLFNSQETSNFTYKLQETNIDYLASFVAAVTSITRETARSYIRELQDDQALKEHILKIVASGEHYIAIDTDFDFGRRLGWYAIARATKPRLIVETGVEQGLGSLVLTAALRRNAEEGSPGIYRGTDINPKAGYLFKGSYQDFGSILYGDSIQSLTRYHR